ncbi:Wzz/FepE/Etk N-terminal domain-containing protein [Flavobacteriaceae bacterium]|nr:Wzz/FepE/Etk N-terminal domain-containing protein [Flavobacteriaceae bacterium]
MKENQLNSYNNFEEDSIDIIALLKTLWIGKKLIVKTTILFFIIGCVVSLLSPVVYTSKTTFVPQVSEDQMSSSKGSLGSLASLAGINLNQGSSTSDSYLSPLLYSKITNSDEFSLKLIDEVLINLNGDKFSIKQYMLSDTNSSFNLIGFIKKYTIGLFLKNDNELKSKKTVNGYNFISQEEFDLVKSFKEKFSIVLNEKEGYIEVIASDKDAFISTQLVKIVTKNLQSRIIELRTNKIKERLEYSKNQYEQKQIEFNILQNNVANFKDSNKNISTARFMSELQKLESEYQLQQNILMTLASEFNNNKIKLNKDTPIFSVIDEVSVPNERSEPKRSLIALIYLFLGVVLSTGYLLAKEPLTGILKNIKEA